MEVENENINNSNAVECGPDAATASVKLRPNTAPPATTPHKSVSKNAKSGDFKTKQSKVATPLGSKTPGNPSVRDAMTPGNRPANSTIGK
jgi:hypothetical protein